MEEGFLEEALKLSKEVRQDLKDLSKLWSLRFFEDLHSASDFARITGASVDAIQKKLDFLEKCIRNEDFISISKEDWPVYNLVNYYDHLIDLARKKERAMGKEERTLHSLMGWRNTAGRFAQMVCSMEDFE